MKRLHASILAALLCSCTSEPPVAKPAAPSCVPQTVKRLDELMQYYGRVKQLPPASLETEHQKMALEFASTQSEASRMRLALLLWMPDTSFHDPDAARKLIEGREKQKGSGLDSFAMLFEAMLNDQAASDRKLVQIGAQLVAERKRSAALQNQIKAIKKMEKTMIRIEKP